MPPDPNADRRKVKIKLKKGIVTPQSKPGNWKDNDDGESASPARQSGLPQCDVLTKSPSATEPKKEPTSRETSPLVNTLDPKIAANFKYGRPLDDELEMLQCKHCKKPILKTSAVDHIKNCQRKKQEKLQKKKEAKEAKDAAARKAQGLDDDDDKPKGAKKAIRDDDSVSGTAKKAKKRKADGDAAEKAPKKKKKDEPKAKQAKTKGPVDVEKQCGVPLPNGLQCARSLTCKSHSMGAKRAVPGRSLPYDMLLQQYQKKNQAKQQRKCLLNAHFRASYNINSLKAPRLTQMLQYPTILKTTDQSIQTRKRTPS